MVHFAPIIFDVLKVLLWCGVGLAVVPQFPRPYGSEVATPNRSFSVCHLLCLVWACYPQQIIFSLSSSLPPLRLLPPTLRFLLVIFFASSEVLTPNGLFSFCHLHRLFWGSYPQRVIVSLSSSSPSLRLLPPTDHFQFVIIIALSQVETPNGSFSVCHLHYLLWGYCP